MNVRPKAQESTSAWGTPVGSSPSVTGRQWAVGERPGLFDGALNGMHHNRSDPQLSRELKGFFILCRAEHIGILLAIHGSGVLVEHLVHLVEEGLQPTCL